MLLWQSYPNIGIDNRNQFDMLRDLPGGLPNVAKVVDAFHARGVHVLWPYNPWFVTGCSELYPASFPRTRLTPALFGGGAYTVVPSTHVELFGPACVWLRDQGTRDEGQPDYVTLPQLLASIGADGFNGTSHDMRRPTTCVAPCHAPCGGVCAG